MVRFLQGKKFAVQRTKLGKRRLRLFAVGCARRAEHLIENGLPRRILDWAEECADGAITPERLGELAPWPPPAYVPVAIPVEDVAHQQGMIRTYSARTLAEVAAFQCGSEAAWHAAIFTPHAALALGVQQYPAELAVQAELLRDIFGNPFRPAACDRAWRTGTVTALARQMYEGREFSAMPILADALQDAGCENDDILTHCRGPGTHVRGCWVVDLVLGKS
jgi:hypothetical protein